MSVDSARERLDEFDRAIARLAEALTVPRTEVLALDGTIRRFAFVFELAWKAIKGLLTLLDPGAAGQPPLGLLKEAFSYGWIDDEQAWRGLLIARNETSHTYKEKKAGEVYDLILRDFALFPALAAKLRSTLP